MLTVASPEYAFQAVSDLRITLPRERRVQLAALVQSGLSPQAYQALDLPVVIGQLSETQQSLLKPVSSLGHFAARVSGQEARLIAGQDYAIADRLVRAAQWHNNDATSVTVKDSHGQRDAQLQHDKQLLTRINHKLLAQRALVSDILRFDRETFGSGRVHLGFDYDQDQPGPNTVKSPLWHRDDALASHTPGHKLTRVYLVRAVASTETMRDGKAYDANGQLAPLMRNASTMHRAAPGVYADWLQQTKAAGMFFQPKPFEVILLTADKTWHKSHRPDMAVPDAFLRASVRPV